MPNAVLSLNAGSSSVKFALFEVEGEDGLLAISHGSVEGIGTAPHFVAKDPTGAVLSERRWDKADAPREELLDALLGWVDTHLGDERLIGIGHRIVHGGRHFASPVVLTEPILKELESLIPLAPLHQPYGLSRVRLIWSLRPGLPQVGCFDTAFHHTLSATATRFALPRQYADEGVRRYGFHGLSYEFIARRLTEVAPDLAAKRVIVAHLGNGASLCAMQDGRSVDTTMGFTALDGLVMGTRCGTIDPGVVLYLQQTHGLTPKQVEHCLYHDSGLLGVSGISSDMRVLLESDDPKAREAVDLFTFRVARETGALASTLGGLDGFVFTAGIGEHAAAVRTQVCARLAWLGVTLDEAANASGSGCISTPESRVAVWVIPTDEEAMIAHHTLSLVRASKVA